MEKTIIPTWVIQDSNLHFKEHKKIAVAIRELGYPIEAIGIIPFDNDMQVINAEFTSIDKVDNEAMREAKKVC